MAAAPSHHLHPTHSHVALRLVRPGSFVRCVKCLQTIEFVPGGNREQVTCRVFHDEHLQYAELFHPECYDTADQPHGQVTP